MSIASGGAMSTGLCLDASSGVIMSSHMRSWPCALVDVGHHSGRVSIGNGLKRVGDACTHTATWGGGR